MNNLLLLTLLAHFIGDYPFQTHWIYAQKIKSLPGSIFHILGLLIAYLLCLAPFLHHLHIQIFIALILFAHFIQDNLKVHINTLHGHYTDSYFLDQILHIFFTVFFWWLFLRPIQTELTPQFLPQIYTNTLFILYLLGLVIITYFVDVTRHVLLDPKNRKFQRGYSLMLRNALVYTIVFLSIIFSANL